MTNPPNQSRDRKGVGLLLAVVPYARGSDWSQLAAIP